MAHDFTVTYVGKPDDDDNVLHIEMRSLRGGTTMGNPLALNRGEIAEVEIEGGGVTLIITETSRSTVMDASTDPE